MVTITEKRLNGVQDNACSNKKLYVNIDASLQRIYGEDGITSPLRRSFDIMQDCNYEEIITTNKVVKSVNLTDSSLISDLNCDISTTNEVVKSVGATDSSSNSSLCENIFTTSEVVKSVKFTDSSSNSNISDDSYFEFDALSVEYGLFYYDRPHRLEQCLCGTTYRCEEHDECVIDCSGECCNSKMYRNLCRNKTEWKHFKMRVQSEDEMIPQGVGKLFDVIEDLWIAYENITSCDPKFKTRVIVINILDFVKKQANISPASVCVKIAHNYLQKENFVVQLDSNLQVQSFEDNIYTASDIYGKLNNFRESVLIQKVNKCMMFCLTFALLERFGISYDTFGYSVMEKRAHMNKFSNKVEFMHSMIDLTLFVLQRGIQIMKTGDINTIFHSSSTYDEIYEKCQVLYRQSKFLDNPEALGFSESSFRGDLDEIIEQLQSIKKHSGMLNKFDRRAISIKLDEMMMMQDTLNCRSHAMKSRDAPLGIMIYGDSGIGKSTIVECLYQYLCKLSNLPNGSEYKYTLNAVAKYWDNFRSQVHTLVVDDIACENPDNVDATSSVTELIRICNNIPYCPDQAALENKGRTPLRVKYVLATSNTMNMNAHVYGSCPSAIQRRLPIIVQPQVKPEYRMENGKNLDTSKIGETGPFPDLWTYDIYVVDPVELDPRLSKQKLAVPRLLKKELNQREFYSFIKEEVKKFEYTQHVVKNSMKSTAQSDLCRCCQMPHGCCLTIQSENVIIKQWITIMSLYALIKWFFSSGIRTGIYLIIVSFFSDWYNYGYSVAKRNALYSYIRLRLNRVYFASLGRQVANAITPELCCKLSLWMGMCYFLKRMQKTKNVVQAASGIMNDNKDKLSSADIGKIPMSEIKGRENVWYNNEVQLSTADFSRPSASAKSVTFNEFADRISQNTISFGIHHSGNKRRNGVALCLYGQVYVTDNHIVPEFGDTTTILIRENKDGGYTPKWEGVICKKDIYRDPENDIAIIVLKNLRPRKDILKYVLKQTGAGRFKGCSLIRKKDGSLHKENLSKVSQANIKLNDNGLENHICDRFVAHPENTFEDGDCGSPMLIETGSAYAIIGLHVASSESGFVVANALLRESLDILLEKVQQPRVQSGNLSLTSSKTVQRTVTDLHKKSVFRYLPEGKVEIYGSFTDFRGGHSSRVEKTPMNNFLSKRGYTTKFGKPEMKSWVPWHIGAKDIVNPITTLRSDILEECADAYIDHIVSEVGLQSLKDILHPIDDFTAVNGAQCAFIDKLNRNTSMGNPYKKSKKYFLTKIPAQHGMLDPVKFDEETMDRVDYICGEYSQGRMVHPNFCAHLKDEPVSQKKVQTGKTRVFTGAPCDWSIVNRKLLLTSCKFFQTFRIETLNACGTIAQSLEWEEMYNHLTKFGDENMVAGDYASFDKRMAPCEILNAFRILIKLCELSGNYSEEEIKMIWCIAMDTAFATVDYNGDLVGLYGSNPSGHPLTVIINGIAGIIRIMYAYREINPDKEIFTFFHFVALLVYGDDNAMGVHRSISWFNHTSISQYLLTHGIVYTMADKETKSIPYISMSNVTFLKRSWVYDKEVDAMLAPLDHGSIEKSLMTWTRSKTICAEAQGIAIISSAMMEYFFYGRKTFETRQKLLKELVEYLGWEEYVEENTFPTYDSLIDRFRKSSRHTTLYDVKKWC